MKILVTVKRVPDPEQKPKFKGTELDVSGANWVVNTFDEYAVETALRLVENADTQERDGEVVVLSIGAKDCAQQIRSTLAMGADRGILVEAADETLDADVVARIVAAVVEQEKPDLLLMGKQSVDSDNSVAAQLCAGMLGWPQATFAATVEVADEGKALIVTREADAGVEKKKVPLPAMVTVDLRVVLPNAIKNGRTPDGYEYADGPRYASLKGIMKAKKKELKEIPIAELGVDQKARLSWTHVEAPPARAAGIKVESVDELMQKLRDEAKVI